MKVRTQLKLEDSILDLAKAYAIKQNSTISSVVEESLKKTLPASIEVHLSDNRESRFNASGPTISQTQLKQ